MKIQEISYKKYGYTVIPLTFFHRKDLFKEVIAQVKEPENVEANEHAGNRRIAKAITMDLIDNSENILYGLYKKDEFIGYVVINLMELTNDPMLTKMYIIPKYRKSKAGSVLLNYILNHRYKETIMRLPIVSDESLMKIVRPLPLIVEFYVFNDDIALRLKQICKE